MYYSSQYIKYFYILLFCSVTADNPSYNWNKIIMKTCLFMYSQLINTYEVQPFKFPLYILFTLLFYYIYMILGVYILYVGICLLPLQHNFTLYIKIVTGPAKINRACEHELHKVVFSLISSVLSLVFCFCKLQKKAHVILQHTTVASERDLVCQYYKQLLSYDGANTKK